ncbi:unnamed protein product [Gongylonema pulchrum]|uniref:Uncharacterized protein n=1 Tax=Gongylonema pulchrum TaxID=637853 RepID=A0A183D5X7_9BILA|nr:unnamed protein product [Gongylonema pulchrum]
MNSESYWSRSTSCFRRFVAVQNVKRKSKRQVHGKKEVSLAHRRWVQKLFAFRSNSHGNLCQIGVSIRIARRNRNISRCLGEVIKFKLICFFGFGSFLNSCYFFFRFADIPV